MLSRCLRAALVSNARRSFSSEAAMEVVQMVDDTATTTTTTTSTTSIISSGKEEGGEGEGGGGGGGRDTLGRRLMSLIYPKRSAVVAIRKWSEEGRTIQKYELNRIVRELRKLKRYKHALEICEWMKTQPHMKLLPGDYALHLDMVAKVRGLASAEKFFEDLPEEMRGEATCSALLHTYVQHKSSVKAEALMKKMLECGQVKNILPYNHMLSLYISTGQLEKVSVVIQQLKKNTTPDVVTYNMWLTVCASENDVESAEKAFRELKRAKLIADWVTYSTLTSLYIKNNLLEKAKASLVDMEKRVVRKNRVAFSSLITLNANMNDKNGVLRIWRRIKATYRKMNDAEYTCMISSLLKLEELKEAEAVYKEWETVSGTGDSRVPNLLLAAYINKVNMEKAEEFLDHMVQKAISPSYTTFELLTWGYLKLGDIEKAMDHFKKAIGSVRNWIADEKIVREIYRILEKKGDIQTAEELLVILRKAGYVTTEIYNSLLRTYEKAGRMPLIVAERMMKDKVKLDEETHQLLKVTSKLCVGDISSIMS